MGVSFNQNARNSFPVTTSTAAHKISLPKVEIYDAMLVENGRVGGVVVAAFEQARQHIETLKLEMAHKKLEMARLAASGEGETVSKPGSPRPAGGQAFFSAAKKQGAVKVAIDVAKK